jgi:hypothetical protein
MKPALFALFVSLLVPCGAFAAQGESAVGSLQSEFVDDGALFSTLLAIGAHDSDTLDPADDDGHVHVSITIDDATGERVTASFDGKVTCLNVVGNVATVSGLMTRTDPPVPPLSTADGFVVIATDGGHPSAGVTPDAAQIFLFEGAIDPTTCLAPLTNSFGFVARKGNITVRDDAP